MEMFRKPTWIELKVQPPVVGMVFIHVSRPHRPLVVTNIFEEEIQRVDVDGITKPWGTLSDWRDEIRSRMIEVVYEPKHSIQEG
jgi:hypothetical protein